VIFFTLCIIGLALIAWAIFGIFDMATTLIGAILGSVTLFIFAVPTTFGASVGITYMIGQAAPAYVASEDVTELRAVALGGSIEGHFFLGTGTVDGKRVINYVAQHEDGYVTVEQVDARNAYIYEDESSNPTVTAHHWRASEWWLSLWPTDRGTNYSFHVPPGSVLENYTIDNAGGTQ
jgi:ABC-type multidrug transport system fused ATPase/permease subunit